MFKFKFSYGKTETVINIYGAIKSDREKKRVWVGKKKKTLWLVVVVEGSVRI